MRNEKKEKNQKESLGRLCLQRRWRGAKEKRRKEREGREKVNKNEYQIKNEKTNGGRTTLKEESKATTTTTKNERKR